MRSKIKRGVITVIVLILAVLCVFIGVLTIAEYRPDDVETVEISDGGEKALKQGEPVRILTWNAGYCALGEDTDFFMDGGKGVITSDEDLVRQNLEKMINYSKALDPDIVLLQEVDRKSKRSHNVNEVSEFIDSFDGYSSTFANNYKALYVPYPWPTLGRIDSGILTLSKYKINESKRISLPCPFKWPVSTCNLKRGLMVDRIPVEGTDSELVVIDLHLEAYDSGEGKIEQTKKLLSVMEEEYQNGNYVIAGGDFNQTFSNTDLKKYPQQKDLWAPGFIDVNDFPDHFDLLMDDRTPTCRSLDRPYKGADKDGFQYYMIDGFIVSDNIDVRYLATNDTGFVNSDHNPVSMIVKLK